eukprot:4119937-Amphidinium_carterae.3
MSSCSLTNVSAPFVATPMLHGEVGLLPAQATSSAKPYSHDTSTQSPTAGFVRRVTPVYCSAQGVNKHGH